LIIIEVTYTNKRNNLAMEAGHLTAALLQKELESFRNLKGYLPQIVTVHSDPIEEKEIEAELAVVAGELNTQIQCGREAMLIEL
jgi:hypothetical protein